MNRRVMVTVDCTMPPYRCHREKVLSATFKKIVDCLGRVVGVVMVGLRRSCY
jgi:hypothetical protein